MHSECLGFVDVCVRETENPINSDEKEMEKQRGKRETAIRDAAANYAACHQHIEHQNCEYFGTEYCVQLISPLSLSSLMDDRAYICSLAMCLILLLCRLVPSLKSLLYF